MNLFLFHRQWKEL